MRTPILFPLAGKRVWVAGHRGMVGSALMHYSFNKAADLLGLGVASVVRIPTDEASRMRCVH